MKITVKGGAWKNYEDEILKAAMMKYGPNQWSRICSLLKKPEEECKARWRERLDPSISETEWTKEQEEKLLHLVKVFPDQWRTIAPIIGKTPSECVEHYEKLSDQIQRKELENGLRKLTLEDIDSNTEAKSAHPDPLDMDEDEKQMLVEARSRLINTRTKRHKHRKVREKKLEEARRLAALQKARELKAAGIEPDLKKKVRGDYNKESLIERTPLQFEYDAESEEDHKFSLHFANISLQTLGGKRISEKLQERDLVKTVARANRSNSIKLVLPSPRVNDKKLREMGKISALLQAQETGKCEVTKFLIGNFIQRSERYEMVDHNLEERIELSEIREQIKSSFQHLPKPKNEYQIELLDIDMLTQESNQKRRLDAEDNDVLYQGMEEERQRRRPRSSSAGPMGKSLSRVPEDAKLRKEAERLLAEEMLRMTTNDVFQSRRSLQGEGIAEHDIFTEKDLLSADILLKEEVLAIKKQSQEVQTTRDRRMDELKRSFEYLSTKEGELQKKA